MYSLILHVAVYVLLPVLPVEITTSIVGSVRSVPVQPPKVYPVFVGLANVIVSVSIVYVVGFAPFVPSFKLYVIVYVLVVNVAVIVWFALTFSNM